MPTARKLTDLTYEEMLELATQGSQVMHNRAVELASVYNLPILVTSSMVDAPGTLIRGEAELEERNRVRAIAHDSDVAKITVRQVPDRPGIAAQVFGAIAGKNIVVDMIVQNISQDGYTDMSFTLPRGDHARAVTVLEEVARNIGAKGVLHDPRVAKVSIVGVGMRSHSGVASKMFATLSREGINIQMISTSEIAVSCVIEDKYAELAVRALHDAFEVGRGSAS